MATSQPAGDGHRNGAVTKRSQMSRPEGANWTRRDKATGRFMDLKKDDKPFSGVRKEP